MAHVLSPQAEADLDDIWLYVARQSFSLEIADRLIETIAARFAVLTRNPYAGRDRSDDLRPGLRSFAVGNYVIFYRLKEEDVQILRVVHGKRDIQALRF